jgi:CRISPR/Cas system-associated protein Cas10 (large subunit of type III CRISPR-Cas system)
VTVDDWDDFDGVQLCEWCENYDAAGLYDLDDTETPLCTSCAEDNFAVRID